MQTKYRPEEMKLRCPFELEDEMEEVLNDNLHKRAKLEKENTEDEVVFSFWPTKSEYWLVAVILGAHAAKRKVEAV